MDQLVHIVVEALNFLVNLQMTTHTAGLCKAAPLYCQNSRPAWPLAPLSLDWHHCFPMKVQRSSLVGGRLNQWMHCGGPVSEMAATGFCCR